MKITNEENNSSIEPERILSRIVNENRQLGIRIPAKVKDKFQIDTKKDGFLWIIIDGEEGLSLHATLIKGAYDEKRNKK